MIEPQNVAPPTDKLSQVTAAADRLVPTPPVPLTPGWWQRSTLQRWLRWLVGISQDNEAGRKFMNEVLTAQLNTAKTFTMHKQVIEAQGKGINGVAAYAQDLEQMIRYLARTDDRLRKTLEHWDEKKARERQLAETPPDEGVILAAGADNVKDAVKNLEPKLEIVKPRIIRPNDN